MMTNIIVRLDKTTKDRFYAASRAEGKTASQKLRELMEGYIRKGDMGSVIDGIWDGLGRRLRRKGVRGRDVAKAIRAVRGGR